MESEVIEIPQPKKVVTLREVVELKKKFDKYGTKPEIMPRYVSIGNVVYDMSLEADRTVVVRALYAQGVEFGQKMEKRTLAPVLPLADKHEKNKRVSRLKRNLSKARKNG